MAAPDHASDILEISSVPSLTAANSGTPMIGGMPMYTPPQTPGYTAATPVQPATSVAASAGAAAASSLKREAEGEDQTRDKRRRIAPTLVEGPGQA